MESVRGRKGAGGVANIAQEGVKRYNAHMKTDQNREPAKPEAAVKPKIAVPNSLSKRVDFAKKVEETLLASTSLSDDEALEAFEKTRAELLAELDEKEKAELEKMKKNAADIEKLSAKVAGWEKEQADMAPGGEDEDWDDMSDFDYETLNSEEYEALTEKIEAGYEKLETLRRKRAELEKKGEWRAKACMNLEKASERFRRKYAQLRDYETF